MSSGKEDRNRGKGVNLSTTLDIDVFDADRHGCSP
jgi:hypothetical protein